MVIKKSGKNIYLTDIKAQNGICVGGLLYSILLFFKYYIIPNLVKIQIYKKMTHRKVEKLVRYLQVGALTLVHYDMTTTVP